MDLFDAAQKNAPTLDARLSALNNSLSAADRSTLQRFTERIRHDGRISINMRLGVLLSFLVSSKHQNIYEWAAARAACSTMSAEQIIREQLGAYYERRTVFDGFFVDGGKMRYGALNIGGAGASRYGSWCSVIKDVATRTFPVAYLRGDSLKTYMLPGPSVDGPAVERDTAPHTQRHCLAAIKHAAETLTTANAKWPEMLCNNDEIIEAIFLGDLTADHVESVRITKAEHDVLYEFAFEDFRAKLGRGDKLEIDTFILVRDELAKRGIPLEVV